MPTGNAKFEAAANEALCEMLEIAGVGAARALVYSVLGGPPAGGVAGVVAGVSALAYAYACTDWIQPTPTEGDHAQGCKSVPAGCDLEVYFEDYRVPGTGNINRIPVTFRESISVVRTETPQAGEPELFTLEFSDPYGASYVIEQVPANTKPLSQPVDPVLCPCQDSFNPDPVYPPFPPLPPYTYTDPDDGCQINVTFLGFMQRPDYNLYPIWQMDPELPPARADGGIIGGCNFSPIVYVQPPGPPAPPVPPIPIPPIPIPGPDDIPWWVPLVWGAIRGLGDFFTQKLLEELFDFALPEWRYTMRAACDYKQDGSFEDYTITLPAAKYTERMLQLAETQLDFLQQHLLWKTPTCGGHGKPLTGDPVTINWISDEVSPASGTRLNKNLTYFDQNNTSLQATVDHWKDFVWQSGAVVVSCANTPLGKPQVWAATEAEGKRVLEHAAQIAGVDLTDAEWLLGTPKDPRFGVPATMRVLKRKGILGITKRGGQDGYPEGLPG